MAKSRIAIWGLLVLLTLSVLLNARLIYVFQSSHDKTYDLIYKIHVKNQEILSEIEKSHIANATDLLRREIESYGNIIAICAIENCSNSVFLETNETRNK